MSCKTQFFFLLPINVRDVTLSIVHSQRVRNKDCLIARLSELIKHDDDMQYFLLKNIRYKSSYNYFKKIKADNAINWILDSLPDDYINDYSRYCTFSLLTCIRNNQSNINNVEDNDNGTGIINPRLTFSVYTPKTQLDCFVSLLLMYIQFIQLQNPYSKILTHIDKHLKETALTTSKKKEKKTLKKSASAVKINSTTNAVATDVSQHMIESYRQNNCCYSNLALSVDITRNMAYVNVLKHECNFSVSSQKVLQVSMLNQWF